MSYSIQPRDRIFVKGYGFLSLTHNMRKNWSGKYSQTRLKHTKQSATDALKTVSNRAIQKTEEAISSLTGNEIAGRIMKVSKTSTQISLKTVKHKHDKDTLKKIYECPEERQKIIDDQRLI